MTRPPALRGPQRSQRKQDLLLASQLARGQVVLAVDDLADRADTLALRIARVRLWLGHPIVWSVLGAATALTLGTRRRRARLGALGRLLRWGWLAWRIWRSAGPALSPLRRAPPAPGA